MENLKLQMTLRIIVEVDRENYPDDFTEGDIMEAEILRLKADPSEFISELDEEDYEVTAERAQDVPVIGFNLPNRAN